MSWAVAAWRDGNEHHGVTIGTVEPIGWDNHVAEVTLFDADIDGFIAEVQAARSRASAATERLDEKLPGAYDRWPHD